MNNPINLRTVWIAVMLIATTMFAAPVFAGGWAVVTLDHLPDRAAPGQPINIGFVVRQHGVTPLAGLNPKVRLQKKGEAGSSLVTAVAEGDAGHYSAVLTFPSEGVWQWAVETGFWPERQPMPDLIVAAGGVPVSDESSRRDASSAPLPIAFGIGGLLGVAGGLLALARTKASWAAAAVLLSGMVSGMGFAAASARAATPAAGVVADEPQAELGERLFIAKGCVICHTHDAVSDVKRQIDFNYEGAPDLTNFTADPAYLAKWLADPASIRPNTFMPDLDLSDEEIGALVEFIAPP